MNTFRNSQIDNFLRIKAAQIVDTARQQFTKSQKRGFVTVVVKNDPKNTLFKEGRFYYTLEEQNNQLSKMVGRTDQDDKLEKDLREYNPLSEAVVLVWYKTLYKVVRITDTRSWN